MKVVDPLKLCGMLWPHVRFYKSQVDVIYSVLHNDETFVPAGNMLGKDFVAGFVALWWFLVHPMVRVVTTSVKDDHLRVLWGEIGHFIQTAKHGLSVKDGGPLVVNHRDLRKVVRGKVCSISYCRGMVSERGEGMAGHHAPSTLFIADEASGVDDLVYTQADTWARKKLIIGNPNPCNNFFYKGVKAGDLKGEARGLYRKVIRIRATDSPNVERGLLQKRKGLAPDDAVVLPGVLRYSDYCKRRATWDRVRQCIGLDGDFYEGAENLLFPPEWLDYAAEVAERVHGRERIARAMGVDSAMGGDNTAWAIVDEHGLLDVVSRKTPDTSVIPGMTLGLMRQWRLEPESVVFDSGGGGQPHADRLRSMGYNVRTVAFGESVTPELRRGMTRFGERISQREERYIYKNRRAQLYGSLRLLIEPLSDNGDVSGGWGLPEHLLNRARLDGGASLRQQLAPIPLWYDQEGRLFLPPKNRRPDLVDRGTTVTLNSLLGCSPDEADALVLAVYGLLRKPVRAVAGVIL